MRVVQHSGEESLPGPSAVTSLDQLPLVLKVAEAAAVLRISRAAAYEQARIWRETDGREGLPVVMVGRSLRVPRVKLEEKLRCESLTAETPATSPPSLNLAP
jgi:Helix-turn-helix domain